MGGGSLERDDGRRLRLAVTWRLLARPSRQESGAVRSARAASDSALRRQGGDAQRQHRHDSVLGGDAVVLPARSPRTRHRSMPSSPARSPASRCSANTGRVFLLAGMAVASVGWSRGTRRFWRSPAPYVMAAGAAIVIAPHVWWLVSERGGASVQFAESVANHASFGDALTLSAVLYSWRGGLHCRPAHFSRRAAAEQGCVGRYRLARR